MATFVKGDIVVMPFPFSDLSDSKRRPALVLSDSQGEDVILCQITSKNARDISAISLENSDLASGSMQISSNIRPNRLFTADKKIIIYTLGRVSDDKYNEVIDCIFNLIKL